jgi:hypothetical protein
MSRKHSVFPLRDGRVYVRFAQPVRGRHAVMKLMFALGYRRGNELVAAGEDVVGVVAWPEDWASFLARGGARRQAGEFAEVLEEMRAEGKVFDPDELLASDE